MTTIQLGPTTTPRENFIAEATLAAAPGDGDWEMVDAESGASTPAQLDAIGGARARRGTSANWHRARSARSSFGPRTDRMTRRRGIELHHQDENGRIVVYYGGLLQTIYHYGMPNYRPYFAPNVAPCGPRRTPASAAPTARSPSRSPTTGRPTTRGTARSGTRAATSTVSTSTSSQRR